MSTWRRLAIASALVVGSTVPVARAAAPVADESCAGMPATVVTAADGSITGTPGDDVVVTDEHTTVVDVGGGADVVCLSPGTPAATVRLGTGRDTS